MLNGKDLQGIDLEKTLKYDVKLNNDNDLIKNLDTIKNLYKRALYGITSVNNQSLDNKTVENLKKLIDVNNEIKKLDYLKNKNNNNNNDNDNNNNNNNNNDRPSQ